MPLSKYQYNTFNPNRNINSNVFSNIDKLNFKTSDSGYVISENWNNPINLDYSSPTTIPMVRATGVGDMLKQAFTFKNLNDAKSNLQCHGKECAKAVTSNTQNLTDNNYIHNLFRGHAWTKHMTASDRGYGYFSIYDDSNVFNENNKYDKKFVKSQSRTQALKPEFVNKIKKYATAGTVVTLLYPGSTHYGEAYRQSKGSMLSTHVGQMIEADGKKYVVDNISGKLHYRPLDELLKGKSKDGVIITGMIDYNSTVNYDMSDLSDFNLNLSNDIQANGTHGNLGGITAYRALLSLDKNKDILMKEFGISENNLGFIQRAIPALMWKESQFGRLDNNDTFNLKNRNVIISTVGKIKNGNINKSRGLSQFKLGINLTKEEIEKLGLDINKLTDEQLYSPELTAVVTSIILDKIIKAIDKALGEKKQNLPDDIYETLIFQSWNQGLNNIIKNINNFKKSNDISEFDGYMKPDEDGKYSYGVTTRELFNHYVDYKTGSLDYKENESHLIGNKHNNMNYIASLMSDINPNINHIESIIKSNINKNIRKINRIDDKIMSELKHIKRNISFRKFGGKLRYGWGGIQNYWDYAKPYLGNANSGSYSNKNGRLAYEKHVNFASMFGSDYVSRSANEVISDKGWDPDKSYVYIQGQGYIPYSELTDAQKNATGVNQGIYTITDDSMISSLQAKDQAIYVNMQNKIDQDIERNQQISTNIARFGGLVGIRRKYPYGGTYLPQSPYSGYLGWGTEVKPEDISYTDYNAQGEGIIGKEVATYATSGLGIGASIGGLIGSVIPGIGNILGALIGAGIGAAGGAGIGSGIGSKNKKEEENRRRELLAEQKETNRQNTISNMQNRYENDVAKIRTAQQQNTFSGQSFYMKHGGLMKPRMKYNNGGTILSNSSDTAVAYGRTHEQVDPITGETGITYGNAEVEGGGLVGNKELPGEVIQQTPNGDRIYSDSLYVPGTRATYAQIAKALTDKKGIIEQEISTLQETLDTSLDTFNKAKLAKAKVGTATRNIEKLAAKLNLKTGELAQVDAQLNDVFTSQEQIATVLGLRDIASVTARFGGYRPKYKFGVAEAGLGLNALSLIGNILATGLSAKSNQAQLDFISKLSVPKTNKVEAEYHTIDTSPYDEASRTIAAETRRFNKWIEDNVSNPQVLRNQKRKNLINYYEGLSDINAKKSDYLSSRYDLNRNARVAARNANNQGKYQDAVNEYNKTMQIINSRMSVNNQTTQNYMASINQLMQAVGSYGMQKLYLAQLPKGVQNEFYFGKSRTATTPTIAASKLYNDYLLNRYGKSYGITNPFNTPRFLFNPYTLG